VVHSGCRGDSYRSALANSKQRAIWAPSLGRRRTQRTQCKSLLSEVGLEPGTPHDAGHSQSSRGRIPARRTVLSLTKVSVESGTPTFL
jgi:hypothetical protein